MADLNDFINELASGKESKGFSFRTFKGSDISLGSHVPFGIPSRIPQLDLSLGRPGWPAGRVIEIFGFEMAGKSSGALAAAASVQRMGGTVLWVDTENAWDPKWASLNGCDPDQVVVAETNTVEGIFKIQHRAIDAQDKSGQEGPLLLVADSVTAVPSLESLDKDYTEVQRLGTDARAIRSCIKKLNPKIAESKATAIYINHNIAKTASTPFAKQSTSAGGHALKFFSSLRVEFINMGTLKDDEKRKEGIKIKIKVEKNKICHTGKMEVECQLLNRGFDIVNNLFDALVDIGEVKRENKQAYSFAVPGSDEVVQFNRKDFPQFVEEYCNSVDKLYEWYLSKAVQKGLLMPYGK